MESTEQTKAEQTLEEVTKAIKQWRQTREKSGPMPASLWEDATVAGRRLGVYPVSKALGLNYQALQNRVIPRESSKARQRRRGRPPKSLGPTFIELPRATPPSSAPADGTVEVVGADGARLTIRLRGTMDLVALVSAFRETRR